jgi:hypothetical protein
VTFNIEFKPLMHNLMSFTKKTGGADWDDVLFESIFFMCLCSDWVWVKNHCVVLTRVSRVKTLLSWPSHVSVCLCGSWLLTW